MNAFRWLVAGLAMAVVPATQAAMFPERLVQESERSALESIQRYADARGLAMPVVKDYQYGMKLDIARAFYFSPLVESCATVPRLMAYENTGREIEVVRYQGQGSCRSQR
ncbi:DUF2790 domain-containing protein [Pseudomonas sp. ABC1]|uniref:DUF2790 domain-containing protein n=1 Tax=Pseudomonas sp. ABC1 TaxID=2748080 RepID=UPI0015C30ED3|nr:DUF2790 domain-containing protein [Pseudomonas sp. ABC1]QLF92902.1 DUF2790 domain-containing protein [Pseudomonas sp. ABC1]